MGVLQSNTAARISCSLSERYRAVRTQSEALCEPLVTEDYGVQSMPDVSPAKWHLAHTSWFFETFVLQPMLTEYRPFHPQFGYLFNSYYNAVGAQYPRGERGLLSRPTVAEVFDYRRHVDEHMTGLLREPSERLDDRLLEVIETGLHHEQQHQELMLMDLKHVFACNPLRPVYRPLPASEPVAAPPLGWLEFDEGLHSIGHDGPGFAYDNEKPRHHEYIPAFRLASRLVTCGEYLQFIDDGGYRQPELWLSDGWQVAQAGGWQAPLYWEQQEEGWQIFTLGGLRRVSEHEPVCHVSYYEADAFARWSGATLPTEAAWERAALEVPVEGNFVETGQLHPRVAAAHGAPQQLFGDLWEWTRSPYSPYPGFAPPAGALGEYNGKFMCNQMVLRGGGCATPADHIRPTYRNFFPPESRWIFSGIRLAKETA